MGQVRVLAELCRAAGALPLKGLQSSNDRVGTRSSSLSLLGYPHLLEYLITYLCICAANSRNVLWPSLFDLAALTKMAFPNP